MNATKKILLIDDDDAFLEINRMILESAGYQVADAQNLEQALQRLQETKYDVVVLDLMMEERDTGFTIAYAIRDDERIRSTPILLLTSAQEKTGFTFTLDQNEDWLKVDDIAAKPLKPAELIERIGKLLGKGDVDAGK